MTSHPTIAIYSYFAMEPIKFLHFWHAVQMNYNSISRHDAMLAANHAVACGLVFA